MSYSKVKTDKLDARALARLLAAGLLESIWIPDNKTRALRRLIARRSQLTRQRTRSKNEIHACLGRNIKPRSGVSDLFGKAGRAWLANQSLPAEETITIEGCLRQIDLLTDEVERVDERLAFYAVGDERIKRLMTIPGVDVQTAATLMGAVGDIGRFSRPAKLVSYLGLDPTVRQSGLEPARHGRISKRGSSHARHVLVEAAWHTVRTPGPLNAFAKRIRSKRGANIAAVAVARKLVVICWHMLSNEADYAFARPTTTRAKMRKLELFLGAESMRGKKGKGELGITRQAQRRLELGNLNHAEAIYERLTKDWQAKGPKKKECGRLTGARDS